MRYEIERFELRLDGIFKINRGTTCIAINSCSINFVPYGIVKLYHTFYHLRSRGTTRCNPQAALLASMHCECLIMIIKRSRRSWVAP